MWRGAGRLRAPLLGGGTRSRLLRSPGLPAQSQRRAGEERGGRARGISPIMGGRAGTTAVATDKPPKHQFLAILLTNTYGSEDMIGVNKNG